ncbi:hypothetical protein BKK52_00825 [Rodentibacter trehalosifermentans]|uniref:Uncharacterized protein n=1 Tax=Rodentibacter trehalosifermentans TaxID=1908263 RepID=A0A1V3J761_9PAST|nr:hypothetical protein [Rodentibacter trehalosifermentans]OOF50724.1 hypothetical protein BKK52_00825 [Rodentibacter trehalosifermentans]
MARNKLLGSARELSDPVMEKYYRQKQIEVAGRMDCDPSTLSRFVANNEMVKTLNFLTALDFGLFDKETHIAVEKSEFEMLLLASQGFDKRLREKYLDK